MLCLTAIDPHRHRVVNHNSISWCRRAACRDRHETRVETRCVAVHRERLAWLIERRLSDGVVVWRKLELYHISDVGFDVIWEVGECAVCISDFDDVNGHSS